VAEVAEQPRTPHTAVVHGVLPEEIGHRSSSSCAAAASSAGLCSIERHDGEAGCSEMHRVPGPARRGRNNGLRTACFAFALAIVSVATVAADAETDAIEDELRDFYGRYAPWNANDQKINRIMWRYKGREQYILPDLKDKYSQQPTLRALMWLVDMFPVLVEMVGTQKVLDNLEYIFANPLFAAVPLLWMFGIAALFFVSGKQQKEMVAADAAQAASAAANAAGPTEKQPDFELRVRRIVKGGKDDTAVVNANVSMTVAALKGAIYPEQDEAWDTVTLHLTNPPPVKIAVDFRKPKPPKPWPLLSEIRNPESVQLWQCGVSADSVIQVVPKRKLGPEPEKDK
jgi:hypothetical protein